MPVCCPPRTSTEPMSSLTLKFLAAASVPVLDWLQVPSCDSCVSCASVSGASAASMQSRPANCGKRFKMDTSVSFPTTSIISINFRQLRQHGTSLRLDVLALILGRQGHQHSTHTAIGLHRLNQAEGLGAYARVRIAHQSFQHRIADTHIVFHK